jgi:hypothetical protein
MALWVRCEQLRDMKVAETFTSAQKRAPEGVMGSFPCGCYNRLALRRGASPRVWSVTLKAAKSIANQPNRVLPWK